MRFFNESLSQLFASMIIAQILHIMHFTHFGQGIAPLLCLLSIIFRFIPQIRWHIY